MAEISLSSPATTVTLRVAEARVEDIGHAMARLAPADLHSQLLREIDNLRDVKGVILLGSTNRPERIEPALLRSGRFDYILPFAKPNTGERAVIMRLCCGRVPLAPGVDFEEFAERTEGLTGADIESLCKKATLLAIAEFQSGARVAPFTVLRSDFVSVLESDRGSPRQQSEALK